MSGFIVCLSLILGLTGIVGSFVSAIPGPPCSPSSNRTLVCGNYGRYCLDYHRGRLSYPDLRHKENRRKQIWSERKHHRLARGNVFATSFGHKHRTVRHFGDNTLPFLGSLFGRDLQGKQRQRTQIGIRFADRSFGRNSSQSPLFDCCIYFYHKGMYNDFVLS